MDTFVWLTQLLTCGGCMFSRVANATGSSVCVCRRGAGWTSPQQLRALSFSALSASGYRCWPCTLRQIDGVRLADHTPCRLGFLLCEATAFPSPGVERIGFSLSLGTTGLRCRRHISPLNLGFDIKDVIMTENLVLIHPLYVRKYNIYIIGSLLTWSNIKYSFCAIQIFFGSNRCH